MCMGCLVSTSSQGRFKAVAPVSPGLELHHKTHQMVGITSYSVSEEVAPMNKRKGLGQRVVEWSGLKRRLNAL